MRGSCRSLVSTISTRTCGSGLAIRAGAGRVLLDNMTADDAARCVKVVRDGTRDVLVELSGGVTLENVRAYADAGVDIISTSAITQSAPALDIALEVRLP